MASKEKGKQNQRKEVDKSSNGPTKMTFEPLNINQWDGNAVKNALDDTAKKIMKEEFGCVEDFKLVDMRLIISILAVAFAGTALAYDYLIPFPASKIVLAVCAISYFIMMAIQNFYATYIEKNIFMVARERDIAGLGADNVWRLTSSLPRFSHLYNLTATYTNGKTKETSTNQIEKSIAEWFDKNGNLVMDKYFADVRSLVTSTSKLGKKD